MENHFVKVEPVEYSRDRIVRYYKKGKRFVSRSLTEEKFKEIIQDLILKKKPATIVNPNGLIIYQYPNKPLIAINLEDGRFYTTLGTIQHYGWKYVRHQASIILRILKKYGYSNPTLKRRSISLKKWCFERKVKT